jgi:hypothetical protein
MRLRRSRGNELSALRVLAAAALALTTGALQPSLSAQGVFDSVPTSTGFCHPSHRVVEADRR